MHGALFFSLEYDTVGSERNKAEKGVRNGKNWTSRISSVASKRTRSSRCREGEEFQAGHIEGALNALLAMLGERIRATDASKRYYVICQGGMRSNASSSWSTKGFDGKR